MAAGPGVLYHSRLISQATRSRLSKIVALPMYRSLTVQELEHHDEAARPDGGVRWRPTGMSAVDGLRAPRRGRGGRPLRVLGPDTREAAGDRVGLAGAGRSPVAPGRRTRRCSRSASPTPARRRCCSRRTRPFFFTEPHYDGYLAVLVRLAAIGVDELEELITDAWRSRAPRALVRAFDEARDGGER